MTTYIHKIKCLGCSLHFAVYSEREDWGPPQCPECGNAEAGYIRWVEESDNFIFEFIPGETGLTVSPTIAKASPA